MRKTQLPPLQQSQQQSDTAESTGSPEPGVDLRERLRQRIQRRHGEWKGSGDSFSTVEVAK